MRGPFSQWAEHLRGVADQMDRFEYPEPGPIPIVWMDFRITDLVRDTDSRDRLRKMFHALMGKAGITDKEAQLEVVQEILGQLSQRTAPITSRADLTLAELGRVCQALRDWETIEGHAS